MGSEAICNINWNGVNYNCKVLLETNEIIVRGDLKLKIPFQSIREVKCDSGNLLVCSDKGTLSVSLGTSASRWQDKIRNPPTLLDKLGIKSGHVVKIIGDAPVEFIELLIASDVRIVKEVSEPSSLYVLFVETVEELTMLSEIRSQMAKSDCVWVVYPKGRKHFTQLDVLNHGRSLQLTDIKICAFSGELSALKFVIPTNLR